MDEIEKVLAEMTKDDSIFKEYIKNFASIAKANEKYKDTPEWKIIEEYLNKNKE